MSFAVGGTTRCRSTCWNIHRFLLAVGLLGWKCSLVASFRRNYRHASTTTTATGPLAKGIRPCGDFRLLPLPSTSDRVWWETPFQQPPGVSRQRVLDMIHRSSNRRDDLVVVVTGATGGLGQAIVHVVLEVGGRVWAIDRDAKALANLVHQQTTKNHDYADKIRTVVADFADLESVARAAQQVLEQLKGTPVDILVNNAGISYAIDDDDDNDLLSQQLLSSQQNYDLLFQINYLSHFLWTELLLPQLSKNHGRIVSVSSGFSWGVNGTGLVPNGTLDPPASRVVGNQSWPRHLATAYSHSKLAQLWHMAELNRRNNNATWALCACPSWAATGISGSESGRQALERLAFPTRPWTDSEVAGPALQSIVNAMFLPVKEMDQRVWTAECMLGNANVLEIVLPKSKDGHNHFLFSPWFDQNILSRIDVTREVSVWCVLLFQRWFYQTLYFQPASAESSNATGQALLYDWSHQAVSPWLPTTQESMN